MLQAKADEVEKPPSKHFMSVADNKIICEAEDAIELNSDRIQKPRLHNERLASSQPVRRPGQVNKRAAQRAMERSPRPQAGQAVHPPPKEPAPAGGACSTSSFSCKRELCSVK
jgi:hypothetical protein